MYDWFYRLKGEIPILMPKEWHEPMRDSIQNAIAFSRKYQMLQADYENRLKADLVAMLTELQLEIEELEPLASDNVGFDMCVSMSSDIIQQKINALREEQNDESI
jgi:iron-sulfur cluster repair protein YtfE (RIC family)